MRTRRVALGVLTALVAAAVVGTAAGGTPAAQHQAATPIKHFITLMQENHTYDNYFGTYPRGDGLSAGTCVPRRPAEAAQAVHPPLPPRFQPASCPRIRTTAPPRRAGSSITVASTASSALSTRLNQDGRLAMGYRDGSDLPYYWNLADRYVLYDRFFSSAMAGSFLNHIYWVSGGPARRLRTRPAGRIPQPTTIFNRLEAAGVSWKFYVQNYNPHLTFRTLRQFPANRASQVVWVPLLSMPRVLDNPELRKHIVPLNQYYSDVLHGTLPAVSYIVPSGPSEHPPVERRVRPGLRPLADQLTDRKSRAGRAPPSCSATTTGAGGTTT